MSIVRSESKRGRRHAVRSMPSDAHDTSAHPMTWGSRKGMCAPGLAPAGGMLGWNAPGRTLPFAGTAVAPPRPELPANRCERRHARAFRRMMIGSTGLLTPCEPRLHVRPRVSPVAAEFPARHRPDPSTPAPKTPARGARRPLSRVAQRLAHAAPRRVSSDPSCLPMYGSGGSTAPETLAKLAVARGTPRTRRRGPFHTSASTLER